MHYNFEWDPNKARSNLSKHGVSFNQAAGQHYLAVVHTHREENSDIVTIRIISARHATRHEIRQYEQD